MNKIELHISKSSAVKCECGNEVYAQTVLIRKYPKLLTGSMEDEIQLVPVFSCTACGRLNPDTMPLGLRPEGAVKEDTKPKFIL